MSNKFALGIDIGGSHLTMAMVDIEKKCIVENSKLHIYVDSREQALPILTTIVEHIKTSIKTFDYQVCRIGVSIPGPLDYKNGISKMFNCNKYENLFGVDIKSYLYSHLSDVITTPADIVFINDANAFLLGETWKSDLTENNVVGITLGTGIGSSFMLKGEIVSSASNVPPNGDIFCLPFKDKRAEDWLGSEWFLKAYKSELLAEAENVKYIASKAEISGKSKEIFNTFGANLGSFLSPLLANFEAEYIILGGNISKSYKLFKTAFRASFNSGESPKISISQNTEESAILGAVKYLISERGKSNKNKRCSSQYVMPISEEKEAIKEGYRIYPSYEINKGSIERGYKSLAKEISAYKSIAIDGYLGVYWDDFIGQLTKELKLLGVDSIAFATQAALKDQMDIDHMIAPFLGEDDPVFGKRFAGNLIDFYDQEKLGRLQTNENVLRILYGPGAAMQKSYERIMYLDIPKNEIQYRSRSGSIFNLGVEEIYPPKEQYKRMFFIDWIVLNKHKSAILNRIDYMVDTQYLDDISWTTGDTLRHGLEDMSKSGFRVRPWFETGVWGGHWIKNKIQDLPQDVINYAWSFEFISPENGIVFSNEGLRLEVSFDFIMYNNNKAVLGDAAETFGYDFPIRFDYLDTFDGENLSLQCHPGPDYMKTHFGERFTQDETYYILDAKPEAEVYLGFKKGVEKQDFYQALVESHSNETVLDVDKYIQKHTAKKHDLFLIPHETIHCSGRNNVVLEISSTPYIYTFKMYDWMRLDLDGQPRPIHIERGMENLDFEVQGPRVKEAYISTETILESSHHGKIKRLSTHPDHFYEVFRYEFYESIEVNTNNQCHILNLVEGSKIEVITGNRSMIIHYAETFIIPSDAKKYKLRNLGTLEAKVIKSNVKPEFCSTMF